MISFLRNLFGGSREEPRTVVRFKRLTDTASIPRYATENSAGMDLVSDVELIILPTDRALVSTGIAMAIDSQYEGQIRPRSGMALKHGVTVLNAPGTIDADYRGEVKVLLQNTGSKPFTILAGDRIAQLVICKLPNTVTAEVEDLDDTDRGEGGFGSTGVAALGIAASIAVR